MGEAHGGYELSVVLLAAMLTVTMATIIGEKVHFWWMTESGFAILVGMALGLALWIYAATQDDPVKEVRTLEALQFDPEIFTLVLLPPIIFDSGYHLNHRFFFSNIGSICIFAFLGTVVAFGVLALGLYYGLGGANGLLTPLEACAFGALISAVDPVATLCIFSSTGADPKLNALIFGESVLNDAVAIVRARSRLELCSRLRWPLLMASRPLMAPISSDGVRWRPIASDCVRVRLSASDCV
jgi:NhaP-type Na+/H+ or K+/H+ antiporter